MCCCKQTSIGYLKIKGALVLHKNYKICQATLETICIKMEENKKTRFEIP